MDASPNNASTPKPKDDPNGSVARLLREGTEPENNTDETATAEIDVLDPSEPLDEDMVIALDVGKKVKVKSPTTAANTFAAKKSVAQGMMDIALITSNANQLRYLLEFGQSSPTFYMNVILITISLLLQVAVGLSLIFKGRSDLRGEAKMAYANRLNNFVVVGVFLVTIINVFVAAFSVTGARTTIGSTNNA